MGAWLIGLTHFGAWNKGTIVLCVWEITEVKVNICFRGSVYLWQEGNRIRGDNVLITGDWIH